MRGAWGAQHPQPRVYTEGCGGGGTSPRKNLHPKICSIELETPSGEPEHFR
jgi:hypothetical protein